MFSKEYLLVKKDVCLIFNEKIPSGCPDCVKILNQSDPDLELNFLSRARRSSRSLVSSNPANSF